MNRYIVTYLSKEMQYDHARNDSWLAEITKTDIFTEDELATLRKGPNSFCPIHKVEKILKTTVLDNDKFLKMLKEQRETENALQELNAKDKEIAELEARLKKLKHG